VPAPWLHVVPICVTFEPPAQKQDVTPVQFRFGLRLLAQLLFSVLCSRLKPALCDQQLVLFWLKMYEKIAEVGWSLNEYDIKLQVLSVKGMETHTFGE